jgi:stearoyl-CoA desaturase (delta-9 desaturase)
MSGSLSASTCCPASGVTVGFHRYFTHRAFKANRALRNGLAIAGSTALHPPR